MDIWIAFQDLAIMSKDGCENLCTSLTTDICVRFSWVNT